MIDPSEDRPKSKGVIFGLLFFLAFISYATFSSMISDWKRTVPPEMVSVTAPPRPWEGSHVTIGGHPACMTREQLGRTIQFLAQRDSVAFDKMIENGWCVILKPQLWVFVMEGNPSSEIVKIRPQGQTDGMWTVRQAID